MKRFSLAAAFTAVILGLSPLPAQSQAGIPGYFVIGGCFKNYNAAQAHASRLRSRGVQASVVTTNDFPNFRNGYHCAASVPFWTRGDTAGALYQFRAAGVHDAYVKYAF